MAWVKMGMGSCCYRLCWLGGAALHRTFLSYGFPPPLSLHVFPPRPHHHLTSSLPHPLPATSCFPSSSSLRAFDTCSNAETHQELGEEFQLYAPKPSKKHLCYYYSQGLCKLAEEPAHLAKFTHVFPDLNVKPQKLKTIQTQPFEYYLVLDLEGMVEILEFPVVMINANTLQVVDRFHRFVRPAKMSEARIKEYIKGKYGRWGLDRVWHDTAIPFVEVLPLFESWLEKHGIWDSADAGTLKQAAFVTCGNWDVKTKIPQQCMTSSIELPPYFWEWINLKDIYLNFYRKRAGGMLAMLKGLKMHMTGTHHVGLDDAHNIARVLQRIIADGAIVKITAKRSSNNPLEVKFKFKNRIK